MLASLGSVSVAYALGASVAGGSNTWNATFLIVAVALALAGLIYAVVFLPRARPASWRPLVVIALLGNIGTLSLALAVAALLRW